MDIEKSVKHYSEWLHHEVSAATREAAWPLVERLVKKESTVPVEKLLADVRQTVKGISNTDVAELVLNDPIFNELAERIQEMA
ncbi:MAG: hypothetical protein HOC09_23295 [Deltaproteobacteria bacterium]|nr:hypothetical protein [Deltaproteobacteria bacterium]